MKRNLVKRNLVKRNQLVESSPSDESKILNFHSIMNLPYSNVYYAQNCLEYLGKNAQELKEILSKGNFHNLEEKDIEKINNLINHLSSGMGYINGYLHNKYGYNK
ncbi:MAG: hypothetical protein ACHQ1D_01685 [Nitrososphaerales archaeon]|jgi:hypothetical protein